MRNNVHNHIASCIQELLTLITFLSFLRGRHCVHYDNLRSTILWKHDARARMLWIYDRPSRLYGKPRASVPLEVRVTTYVLVDLHVLSSIPSQKQREKRIVLNDIGLVCPAVMPRSPETNLRIFSPYQILNRSRSRETNILSLFTIFTT